MKLAQPQTYFSHMYTFVHLHSTAINMILEAKVHIARIDALLFRILRPLSPPPQVLKHFQFCTPIGLVSACSKFSSQIKWIWENNSKCPIERKDVSERMKSLQGRKGGKALLNQQMLQYHKPRKKWELY